VEKQFEEEPEPYEIEYPGMFERNMSTDVYSKSMQNGIFLDFEWNRMVDRFRKDIYVHRNFSFPQIIELEVQLMRYILNLYNEQVVDPLFLYYYDTVGSAKELYYLFELSSNNATRQNYPNWYNYTYGITNYVIYLDNARTDFMRSVICRTFNCSSETVGLDLSYYDDTLIAWTSSTIFTNSYRKYNQINKVFVESF